MKVRFHKKGCVWQSRVRQGIHANMRKSRGECKKSRNKAIKQATMTYVDFIYRFKAMEIPDC